MELVANFTLDNNSLDANFDVSEVENFDALFEIYAGGVTWGNISGNIENQTDLQNALSGLSDDIGDLSTTVTNNYNELNSSIDSNHQAISNINNTIQSYGDIVSYDAADFATSAQGALADTALQPNDNISELTNDVGYITSASLPVVNNNRITIQKNGSPVGDFTLNQSNDEAINLSIPTTAADVGALPDTTTINDLTTMAQQEALNSGANTTNIGQISANAQAIQTETNNRTNADNNLQSQIDALVVSSDVFDIVGTYAELQAYDISTVPVNDIIKVLVDSTHNDAATYYRCIENNNVKSWSYIGSEGPYYTKSETDSTFVPQTRTINGQALSSNVNLTASDVGALPDSTIIPTVNNGTLTIQANGTTVGTFTANQSGNTTANIVVPDSATWGNITGNISNQTDLQSALDNKQDILTAGTDLEIVADSILPSGYTQLNSITSTGAQYINTGLVLTDNFKAEIVGRFTSTTGTQCVLGVTVATASTTYKNTVLGKSSQYYVNNGNPWYQPQLINSSVPIDTNKHTFVIEITSSTTKISVDGVESSANYTNFNTDEDLFLFANNAVVAGGSGVTSVTDFAQFEAESIKLYNGGNLIFNGVPASYGNQAGLYDTVSETFMPSLGTSDFVAGSEISQKIINFTNDSGYITGINSNDVTTALGYTPYNSTNPDGYISSASVSSLTDVTLSNLTNGQGLIYNSTTQKWENTTIQTSTAWGSITGTLSNQTDLQNALNAKSTVTIVDWTV